MKQFNTSIKEKIQKIGHNHSLMMVVCCGTPLILLVIAIYFFGLSKSYLFWFILLICPIMHFWMMGDMHKEHLKKEENGKHH